MLIPKCCKRCSNRSKGNCCCSLPDYCHEYVEDDGSNYSSYQIKYGKDTTPTMGNYKIGDYWAQTIDGTENEALQKDKDEEIDVLNMALDMVLDKLLPPHKKDVQMDEIMECEIKNTVKRNVLDLARARLKKEDK